MAGRMHLLRQGWWLRLPIIGHINLQYAWAEAKDGVQIDTEA